MSEIAFIVDGFPPAKNEALSMFGAGHSHSPRVIALLRAAGDEVSGHVFVPFAGPIGLDVVLYSPSGVDPWDATNYLGGIADVLQDKAHLRISTTHLGALVKVSLYKDDRQIREIHYRQEERAAVAYRVRVWSLP